MSIFRSFYKLVVYFLLPFSLFVSGYGELSAADIWSNIVGGIQHLHRQDIGSAGPRNIHVLKIDLRSRYPVIRPILAQNALGTYVETTSSMAVRTGAIAAINGDYFGSLGPSEGTTIISGKIYDIVAFPRSIFGVSNDNAQVDIGIWTSKSSLPSWDQNMRTLTM